MPSSADAKTPNTTQQYYKSKTPIAIQHFRIVCGMRITHTHTNKHWKRIEKNNNNKF